MSRLSEILRGASQALCGLACLVLVMVIGMRATPGLGAIIQIDTFATPSPAQFFILGSGSNPTTTISYNSPDVIGGQRDTLVSVIGQGTPTSVVGIIGHDQSYNMNALQVGTNGLSPTVVTLLYSGLAVQASPAALINAHALASGFGMDLTGGGTNDRFQLHFYSSDARPTVGLDVTVTVTSPDGKLSTATVDAPNSTTAFDLFIPFSKLVGNAVLTNVDSIKFVFNGVRKTPNIDYEVQLLAIVPEPAATTLMVSGLLTAAALSVARRRRRARIYRSS
jgi:hypothetical protein